MRHTRCQAQLTVDAKGRLALPRPIRAALEHDSESELVLAFHKGAVWAWTRKEWEAKVEAPLAEADPFDTRVMAFTHALLSTANDVAVDGQGRIRIPPVLRELAGIERDVVVHSVVNRFEIWDRHAWNRRFEESLHETQTMSGMPRGRDGG